MGVTSHNHRKIADEAIGREDGLSLAAVCSVLRERIDDDTQHEVEPKDRDNEEEEHVEEVSRKPDVVEDLDLIETLSCTWPRAETFVHDMQVRHLPARSGL